MHRGVVIIWGICPALRCMSRQYSSASLCRHRRGWLLVNFMWVLSDTNAAPVRTPARSPRLVFPRQSAGLQSVGAEPSLVGKTHGQNWSFGGHSRPVQAAVVSGSSFDHFTMDGAKYINTALFDGSSHGVHVAPLQSEVCLSSNYKFFACVQMAGSTPYMAFTCSGASVQALTVARIPRKFWENKNMSKLTR